MTGGRVVLVVFLPMNRVAQSGETVLPDARNVNANAAGIQASYRRQLFCREERRHGNPLAVHRTEPLHESVKIVFQKGR